MNYSIVVLATILLFHQIHLGAQDIDAKPVTIIELFTSQGCSSCPSADRLMTELLHESYQNEVNLIGLSFHVSYWNRLGWQDPYSKEAFTERQRAYGRAMKLNTIYTPQLIVNGIDQIVGSSRSKIQDALSKSNKTRAVASIRILNLNTNDDEIIFQFEIVGDISKKVLNLALVERNVENYVPRGENSGLTLKHDNVVKQFKTVKAQRNGFQSLPFNKRTDHLDKCSLIAYIQNEDDLRIIGGSQIPIID